MASLNAPSGEQLTLQVHRLFEFPTPCVRDWLYISSVHNPSSLGELSAIASPAITLMSGGSHEAAFCPRHAMQTYGVFKPYALCVAKNNRLLKIQQCLVFWNHKVERKIITVTSHPGIRYTTPNSFLAHAKPFGTITNPRYR